MANLFFRTNIAPYRIDIYNALHEKLGCEMYFYWAKDSSQEFNEDGMRKLCRFSPHYLNGIKLGRESRKLCTGIWSLLKSHNPEIVIVPEFQILAVQVLLFKWIFRKKFKVISMCDDSYDMIINKNDFTFVHRLARKFLASKMDDILVVDSRVRDWYQKSYHKGIWLPIIRDEKIELEKYANALPISEAYREKFDIKHCKTLLFVGRFDPVKNLVSLIDAIDKCQEGFTTIFVGSGELENVLRNRAATSRKRIIFAGHYVDDGVRAWYNIADVFILPSIREAFGAVTNEALIAGNYVIVSEHAGSACLVNPANGVVIDPLDTDGISQAIDNCMRNIEINDSVKQRPHRMPFDFESVMERVIKRIKE